MNLDVGRSVTYPFEDKQWSTKVGLLFVAGFVPGLNLILWSGYALTVARNIIRRKSPLPAWDNWSDIAVRGLLSIVATFIYLLPSLLVVGCFWLALPLFVSREASSILTTLQCAGVLFNLVYLAAVGLLLSAGQVRFAQTDQFKSYFDIGARLRDLQKWSNVFISLFITQTLLWLIAIAVAAALSVTCIGTLAVLTLAFLANGYILGTAAAAIPFPQ